MELPNYPASGMDDIQGMDIYSDKAAIHAVLAGKPAGQDKVQLTYLNSTDYGATWGKPVTIPGENNGKVVSRRGNDAQIAVSGRRIVTAFIRADELPNNGPIAIAYSSDGGASWRAGQNPANGDGTRNQSYMDMVADQSGNFHLIWLDDREESGNSQGLRYSLSADGGRHWQGDVTLDLTVCTCCWNRLVNLGGKGFAALYRDEDPHDMSLTRISANGKSWRNLGGVGAFGWRFSGCPHCGGGIAYEAGKTPMLHSVVWSGKEGSAGLYYLNSADLGGHWSTPARVGDGHSRESDIAVLHDGRVGVVFVEPAGSGGAVRFIGSADHGKTWSPPRNISADGMVADHPRIIPTPAGFRAFWTEKHPAQGKAWATQLINHFEGEKPSS